MRTYAGRQAGERIQLFGVPVDALTLEQSVEKAFTLVADPTPSQHVVLNASKVVQLEHDSRLREIVAGCEMVNADGVSIVWASRILGAPVPERVTGIDVFHEIVKRSATTGHRLYFLGATDETLERMLARFNDDFPGIQVAGSRNGYWADDEVDSVIAAVREAAPDFLFLAIPSPKKEFWLNEHLQELGVPFVMGVGGSFDVMAGLVRRAPRWAQRLGCEWLFRLVQEPGRMWKRYLIGNTKFLILTIRDWARLRALRTS